MKKLEYMIVVLFLFGCHNIEQREITGALVAQDLSMIENSDRVHIEFIDSVSRVINGGSYVRMFNCCFEEKFIYENENLLEEKPVITEILKRIEDKNMLISYRDSLKKINIVSCDYKDPIFGRSSKGLSDIHEISNLLDDLIKK